MENGTSSIKDYLSGLQKTALIVGIVAAIATGYGFTVDRMQFFQSYLMGFMFTLGLPLGSLGWLMIQHLANGKWSYCVRRAEEAAVKTLPLLAVMFLPILLGMSEIYPWTHAEYVEHHEVLAKKTAYLATNFFIGRAGFYFVVWTLIGLALTGWSRKQDRTGEADLTRKMRALSGIGLVIYGLTGTFAMIDWMMSLEPEWYSTIYGVHALVGMGLTTLAFLALLMHAISKRGGLQGLVGPQQFHDIGNLMFAFTILWTYMNVGQLIIIWSGNLPEENTYYLTRITGTWRGVAYFLTFFQFVIPFLLLLSRRYKRTSNIFIRIAWVVILTRVVDYLWLIGPRFHTDGAHLHWLNATAPLALFGIWFALYLQILKRAPLLPLHDPVFSGLLTGQKHDEVGWEVGDEI